MTLVTEIPWGWTPADLPDEGASIAGPWLRQVDGALPIGQWVSVASLALVGSDLAASFSGAFAGAIGGVAGAIGTAVPIIANVIEGSQKMAAAYGSRVAKAVDGNAKRRTVCRRWNMRGAIDANLVFAWSAGRYDKDIGMNRERHPLCWPIRPSEYVWLAHNASPEGEPRGCDPGTEGDGGNDGGCHGAYSVHPLFFPLVTNYGFGGGVGRPWINGTGAEVNSAVAEITAWRAMVLGYPTANLRIDPRAMMKTWEAFKSKFRRGLALGRANLYRTIHPAHLGEKGRDGAIGGTGSMLMARRTPSDGRPNLSKILSRYPGDGWQLDDPNQLYWTPDGRIGVLDPTTGRGTTAARLTSAWYVCSGEFASYGEATNIDPGTICTAEDYNAIYSTVRAWASMRIAFIDRFGPSIDPDLAPDKATRDAIRQVARGEPLLPTKRGTIVFPAPQEPGTRAPILGASSAAPSLAPWRRDGM